MTSEPDLFGRRPFKQVVREVFDRLGNRASDDELVDGVRATITLDEYEAWSAAAFRGHVTRSIRSRVSEDGADAVYAVGDGEYATLRLFSVEEFEEKALQLARQRQAATQAIYMLADVCREVHGRTFDPDEVIDRAAS